MGSAAVLLAFRLSRLGREVPLLVLITSFLWAFSTLVHAVILRSFWPAIFALSIAFMGSFLSAWLRSVLSKPAVECGLRWFMGLPDGLPGVHAKIEGSEQKIRVAALDRDGAFLFRTEGSLSMGRKKVNIEFQDQAGRAFRCSAVPTVAFRKGQAVGIRFLQMDLMNSKRSGDMIEALKGVGYEA